MYLASPLTADDILSYGIPNVALATGARWRRDGIGLTRQRPLPGLEEADEGARLFTPDDFLGGGDGLDRMPAGPVVVEDGEGYTLGRSVETRGGRRGVGACETRGEAIPSKKKRNIV